MNRSTVQVDRGAGSSPKTEQEAQGFSFAGIHHDRELGGLKWVLRLQAIGNIIMAVGLVVMMYYTILLKEREKIQPWFIEVSEPGQVRSVKLLETEGYTPEQAVVFSYLKQLIQRMFDIPSDGMVLRRNMESASKMFSGQAASFFQQFVKEVDPNIRRRKGEYVATVVNNIIKIAGTDAVMAEWTTHHWLGGQLAKKARWKGSFGVKRPETIKAAKEIDLDNPLQIEITDMNWEHLQ